MMNYLLTLMAVYAILNEVFIKDFKSFVISICKFLNYTDEPVEDSLTYLYLAIYAGMMLDMLAFSGRSMNYFYAMTGVVFLYFLVRLLISNVFKDLKKILFME